MAGTDGDTDEPGKDPWEWLANNKWAGIGVLVAILGIVLGLIFSQSGGTSNVQTGNTCAAQGSGNTVNCTAPSTQPTP